MEELDALLVGANVLSQSSTKDNDHEELHQSNGSESEEDGFEIATRGGLRDTADLEKNGLEPVWTTWKGYPGHIPEKIAEYLDDNGDVSGIQLIGPIKSLFWLGGYDDVVEAIDDPAFVIEDEIQFVPLGATVGYLVVRYFEQGKLPVYMMRRELWYDAPFLGDQTNFNAFPARVNIIPRSITNDPRTDTLQSLYPLSRPQCLPQAVQCFRVKAEKHIDRQMRKIRSLTPNIFDTENLWFRGLTLAALTCTLAFFIPAMATRTHDNEFGPGFYTTNDFPYALAYSTSTGAVMVFKNPDLRGLKVWEPTIDQWNHLTATWTLSPQSGVNDMFPLEYKDADFIRGPISELGEKGKLRKRSDKDQLVAVSYKGCAVLSASLHTIIYIEP